MAPESPPRFFFVRHGETDWNREGRLQGGRDTALNALGRRQAAAAGTALGRVLSGRALHAADLTYTASPLSRTRDTMELLRATLQLPPGRYGTDDRLVELSFGRWEGLTWADVKRADPAAAAARLRDRWRFVPPGGESYAGLMARVSPWLAELAPDAVVVAHGGVARVLLHLVTGLEVERATSDDIHQGRVLLFEGGAAHWV